MKKLLLILSAVFVSVMGWAGLNPYAYGLKSYLNDDQTELTMIYTLNADAEKSKENNPTAIGVQVYIFEKENGNIVKTLTNGCITQGTCTLTVSTADLPREVPLSWKVVVYGNAKQTQPNVVFSQVSKNRPNATHGVAIDKNPESPNFGNIYYTEASSGNLNTTWDWMEKYTRPCVWQYSPQLTYQGYFYKDKENNVDVGNFVTSSQVEPHRIRISDDNRIFVSSCYANATTAVWEYKGGNNFNKVITRTSSYGRVVGMDVFGSGNNLKILLCYINEDVNKLTFREYALGSAGSISGSGTDKGTYTHETLVVSGTRVGVAYDDNGESFWFAIDRSPGYSSRVIHMKKSGSNYVCGTVNKCPLNTGGDGIFVKGNLLVKGIATSGNDKTAAGRLYFFKIDGDKIMNDAGTASLKYYNDCEYIDVWTSLWVNGMDMDYAGNLYIACAYNGNAIAISMPYDGQRETKARDVYTFTVSDPVPNILATDLTYAPYGNENKYEFSFNVNTKPEVAQIRFYANEADMLANNGNYSFYYEFSEAERKQGRMSVIFDAVGGTVENKLLNDPNGNGLRNLPRGEYYWNVYVKTRKSCAFAPIYTQKLSDFKVEQGDYSGDSHRQHATVDNNPNNKGFGHIYVADHHNIADENSRKHYVRAYTIGNATGNAQQDNQNNINDDTRYTTHWQVRNTTAHYTRRPAVAPDGMVYITDEGTNGGSVPTLITYGFEGAGMWVLDPNRQNDGGDVQWISPNFSTKTPNQEVVTALSFLLKDENWYIYKTNTYSEIEIHGPDNGGTGDLTSNESWQKNGYRIYQLDKISGLLKHSGYDDAQTTTIAFGGGKSQYNCGDANGKFSIVATKNGVWMCQHRMGSVIENDGEKNPDGKNSLMLSFFDHQGNRKYTSYEDKTLTQQTTSDFQASPGAGMAYQERNGVEYLYVVNHNGYILEFKITGGNNPQLTLTQKFPLGDGNKGKHGAVSSMNFDYAGNLVVTAGQTYGNKANTQVGSKVQIERDHQDLVIYTMPYPNQENARAIPASEAFRLLPERVAHLDMGARELELIIQGHEGQGCAIDLYRPLQGGEFNTICLPFTLNLTTLPEGHPLKDATLKQYTRLNLNTVGGEKVLELVFTDVSGKVIAANQPYIIQPPKDIPHIISFDGPLELTSTTGDAITWSDTEDDKTYSITHQGIVPFQYVEPKKDPNTGEILTLMLVADNRLAAMTRAGNMLGFRGYFQLNQSLPKGMQTRITTSKGTTTNTTIVVDGKKVNVEKYLQEGRVYIRMGDSLYTITGEKVE